MTPQYRLKTAQGFAADAEYAGLIGLERTKSVLRAAGVVWDDLDIDQQLAAMDATHAAYRAGMDHMASVLLPSGGAQS